MRLEIILNVGVVTVINANIVAITATNKTYILGVIFIFYLDQEFYISHKCPSYPAVIGLELF